jgi:hypothetical protein
MVTAEDAGWWHTPILRYLILEKKPSSRMWHCVDLVWPDVSEERIASIFRVEKSASEEPVWAGVCRLSYQLGIFDWQLSLQPLPHAGSSLADFSTLKMGAIHSSERSVHTRSTWRHIPGDSILHSHCHENLKPYMPYTYFWQNTGNHLIQLLTILRTPSLSLASFRVV